MPDTIASLILRSASRTPSRTNAHIRSSHRERLLGQTRQRALLQENQLRVQAHEQTSELPTAGDTAVVAGPHRARHGHLHFPVHQPLVAGPDPPTAAVLPFT